MKILVSLLLLLCLALPAFPAGAISDDEIHDKVRIRLAGDRELGGEKIDVQVENGVVELSGTVAKESLRSRAERLAKKVKGVQKVVNHIKIAPA
jgi:osmotically-inducible protein OsmY